MKLWDKGKETEKLVADFTAGKDSQIDYALAAWDIVGTLAHVKMLEKAGLVTGKELHALEAELRKIYRAIENGDFIIEEGVEDVHSQVELMLTAALGDTGKKVHTARSRNDQVLVDLKLFTRAGLRDIAGLMLELFYRLLDLSNRHKDVLMPGYTHMQVAMPSSFGLWFGAWAECLTEDMLLLEAAYRIADQNPLGSAAGFGSSFPVDREFTTSLLGFGNMHVNVVNAQMSRGRMEKAAAFAIGSAGSTLSRLAGDICLYSGQNYGFIKLPEKFTTGSSIMPHKKNPDVFELVRATGNRLQSLPAEISMICANLPSGYHRDYQLIKETYLPAFSMLSEIISVTNRLISEIGVNEEILDNNIYNDLFSVEEVNRLVMGGMPFREAYRTVAGKIDAGGFKPLTGIDHTHSGSIGNLCNELIEAKMEKIMSRLDFTTADKAIAGLLG